MITHAKKLFILTLLLFAGLASVLGSGQSDVITIVNVHRVIDGDTIVISGGERVRLLGIDAPEKGESLFDLASDRLRELISTGPAELEVCEKRDEYGRLLATLTADGTNINQSLLREGMALPMLIPPCGRNVAAEILQAASMGALSGKGIYSLTGYGIISHIEAGKHVGEHAVVKGRVLGLYRGKKAWHFNFGPDWRTDFTAVLFKDGQQRFSDLYLDPAKLVGLEVLVMGKVKRYNGPEIIIHGPDQILPIYKISDP